MERFLTVWSLGIDLAPGWFAVVRGFFARAWLFDIVKRVLTYSLRRGSGGASARLIADAGVVLETCWGEAGYDR
jgi:hypothetical protein